MSPLQRGHRSGSAVGRLPLRTWVSVEAGPCEQGPRPASWRPERWQVCRWGRRPGNTSAMGEGRHDAGLYRYGGERSDVIEHSFANRPMVTTPRNGMVVMN